MGYRTQEQLVEEIVRLRKERDMSQAALGETLGLDPSAVNRIENGGRGIAAAELAGIAEALGTTVEALVYEQGEEAVVFRGDSSDPAELRTAEEAIEQVDQVFDTLLYYRALVK